MNRRMPNIVNRIELPDRLKAYMATGWTERPLDVSPVEQVERYAARRAALSTQFPDETLVIPTGYPPIRANDTEYRFRPGTAFVWLTGQHEPEAVLVMRPSGGGHDAVLYQRPRSSKETDEFYRNSVVGELCIGRRLSPAETSLQLGIDVADIDDLESMLTGLDASATRVLRGLEPAVDHAVGVAETSDDRDQALATALSELRMVKDAWEIAQLQDAIAATVHGFEDVVRALPMDRSVSERLAEGIFGLRARHDGNDVGYLSIVGGGSNGTKLHWTRNDGRIRPGELALMDMGVENTALYTADVTRTIPVSGQFTPLQRDVYGIVYAAQQAGIDVVKPGADHSEIMAACAEVLAQGLHDLGLLPVPVAEALDKESMLYWRWSLHGVSHHLGIDVHDCAQARREKYRDGTIEEGYVFTVEPGLYFQEDDELVPAELRGIGVRIEDDILVTADGPENRSAGLPRHPDEVENWVAEQRGLGFRLPG
jgi:Xaa-Pro aminopeptidase